MPLIAPEDCWISAVAHPTIGIFLSGRGEKSAGSGRWVRHKPRTMPAAGRPQKGLTVERHFTSGDTVSDIVIGMSDG